MSQKKSKNLGHNDLKFKIMLNIKPTLEVELLVLQLSLSKVLYILKLKA